jgi:hypothetical protein
MGNIYVAAGLKTPVAPYPVFLCDLAMIFISSTSIYCEVRLGFRSASFLSKGANAGGVQSACMNACKYAIGKATMQMSRDQVTVSGRMYLSSQLQPDRKTQVLVR